MDSAWGTWNVYVLVDMFLFQIMSWMSIYFGIEGYRHYFKNNWNAYDDMMCELIFNQIKSISRGKIGRNNFWKVKFIHLPLLRFLQQSIKVYLLADKESSLALGTILLDVWSSNQDSSRHHIFCPNHHILFYLVFFNR